MCDSAGWAAFPAESLASGSSEPREAEDGSPLWEPFGSSFESEANPSAKPAERGVSPRKPEAAEKEAPRERDSDDLAEEATQIPAHSIPVNVPNGAKQGKERHESPHSTLQQGVSPEFSTYNFWRQPVYEDLLDD